MRQNGTRELTFAKDSARGKNRTLLSCCADNLGKLFAIMVSATNSNIDASN